MRTYRGWTVAYERPWWYAQKAGQCLNAHSRKALIRMIDRRES